MYKWFYVLQFMFLLSFDLQNSLWSGCYVNKQRWHNSFFPHLSTLYFCFVLDSLAVFFNNSWVQWAKLRTDLQSSRDCSGNTSHWSGCRSDRLCMADTDPYSSLRSNPLHTSDHILSHSSRSHTFHSDPPSPYRAAGLYSDHTWSNRNKRRYSLNQNIPKKKDCQISKHS